MNPIELRRTIGLERVEQPAQFMKERANTPLTADDIAQHQPAGAPSYSVAITHFLNNGDDGLYVAAAGRSAFTEDHLTHAITTVKRSSGSTILPKISGPADLFKLAGFPVTAKHKVTLPDDDWMLPTALEGRKTKLAVSSRLNRFVQKPKLTPKIF